MHERKVSMSIKMRPEKQMMNHVHHFPGFDFKFG